MSFLKFGRKPEHTQKCFSSHSVAAKQLRNAGYNEKKKTFSMVWFGFMVYQPLLVI